MKNLKYELSPLDDTLREILDKEDVIIYGYAFDEEVTHLIYLLNDGDLIYSTFSNGDLKKSQIGKFDTKSNYYHQLEILYINGKLNIFYAYSNFINSNIFTLHHIIYKDNIESRFTIIRYISKKTTASFSVDFDSYGNIHLLYNTLANDISYIFYTYYNCHKNSWLRDPIKMSQNDKYNENPFIFVDSKDNIHGIWWEDMSNLYVLKYYRMSSSGNERFKWSEVSSLKVESSVPDGILKENDNIISLIYGDESNYFIANSIDYGLSYKPIGNYKVSDIKTKEIPDENNTEKTPIVSKDDMIADMLNQITINQKNLEIQFRDIIEDLAVIKAKIAEIEENSNKNSFFKRLFS
jgi:hypothetical protein